MKRWIFLLLYLCLSSWAIGGTDPKTPAPFNETHTSDGRLRPAYQRLTDELTSSRRKHGLPPADLLRPPREIEFQLTEAHPLGDRISIHPIPLALSTEEQRFIAHAGNQRARALAAFFADVVVARHAPESVGVSTELVDQILHSTRSVDLHILRFPWLGRSAEDVSFIHGMDIARAPNGDWVVYEDNVGSVGGTSDVDFIRHAFLDVLVRERTPVLRVREGDYTRALRRWISLPTSETEDRGGVELTHTVFRNDSRAVFSRHVDNLRLDLEHHRERATLRDLGVTGASFLQARIIGKPISESDLTIVRGQITHLQSEIALDRARGIQTFPHLHPQVLERLMKIRTIQTYSEALEAAALVDACLIHNIADTHFTGDPRTDWLFMSGTRILLAPGTADLLGSKALLPFVERFIWHYLGEKPLIHTAPTTLLNLETDLTRLTDRVLKMASGTQGAEVEILPRQEPERRAVSLERIRHRMEKGELWIAQHFFEPSRIGEFSVELRPISFVLGKGFVQTYGTPWGRATDDILSPDRKGNVTQGARELVVSPDLHCPELLTRFGSPVPGLR